jgi:hypothetical protein
MAASLDRTGRQRATTRSARQRFWCERDFRDDERRQFSRNAALISSAGSGLKP